MGKKTKRKGDHKPRAGRQGNRRTDPYGDVIREFALLVRATNPLDAELAASGAAGTLWSTAGSADPAAGPSVEALIERAGRTRVRGALALLRALAVVAETAAQRNLATATADALAATGIAEPAWTATIGRVTPGACWRLADVHGDQATLLLPFAYGSAQHGFLVVVDHTRSGGWAQDVLVADNADAALWGLRTVAAERPTLRLLESIDQADARAQVEAALATTDELLHDLDDDVDEGVEATRPLLLARCRLLTGGPDPVPARSRSRPTTTQQAALVDEFLAAPQAHHLPRDTATRRAADLLAEFGGDRGGDPLRFGPARLDYFLLRHLAFEVDLDDAEIAAVPPVTLAWARWGAERRGLPATVIDDLLAEATVLTGRFEANYHTIHEEITTPARGGLLTADLDHFDDDALRDAVNRRLFAVPAPWDADDEFGSLDPTDPDQRAILIEREHPQYRDALDDPGSNTPTETIDGVNPRLHVAMHEIVANWLWDGDPPEAWDAARRLTAAGVDRHEVLHRLMGVASNSVYGAIQGTAHDPGELRRQLEQLV